MSRTTVSRLVWGSNREEAVTRFVARKSGAVIYRHKTLPIVAIIANISGRPVYAVWSGNGAKPCAYYSAATPELARKFTEAKWKACVAGFEAAAATRAAISAKRATLKASDHYMVGDVIVNTWGYDQTNVDFYQVTHVGERSVKLRRLHDKRGEDSFMAGKCQPDRFNFKGEEIRKTLRPNGGLSFEFGGAHKWDGKPERYSSYA